MKSNFLTRETFQDVILSCHAALMVIAWFSKHHRNLPCALDRMGTDGVEVYFSMKGSWVIHKHTYPILDMLRNLKAMNRLNQIKAANPNLKFKKKHSKQTIFGTSSMQKKNAGDLLNSYQKK